MVRRDGEDPLAVASEPRQRGKDPIYQLEDPFEGLRRDVERRHTAREYELHPFTTLRKGCGDIRNRRRGPPPLPVYS